MKGLFVFSHHMEDGEALTTRALLKRAGLEIVTITFEKTLEIKTSYDLTVKADHFAHDVHLDQYDFVVIPGGRYVNQVVDQDVHIKELVKYFYQKKKLIAAICAGPRFLGQAGILDNRHFTAYPSSEKDMPNGIYHRDLKAITDGDIITGRSAGSVYEFSYEIVKYLLGEESAKNLLSNILF